MRRCALAYSLCKLQEHFSNVLQTPGLGQRGNPWLNIACLAEKVQTKLRRIGWMLGSVKVVMVRAILPENQYPVPSNIGERRVRNESFDNCTFVPNIDKGNETDVMRYTKSIIKDMSGWPKTTSFCILRTTVSTKGGNSHVAGGLGVTAHTAYVLFKDIRRRNSPVDNQMRKFSTSIVLAKNVLNKLDSLNMIAKNTDGKINSWNLYKDFMLNPDMYLAAYQKLRSNPGNMIPGINPLDGLSTEVIEDIINKLRKGSFKFSPGRRVEIPKSHGMTCPLWVGSPRDKLVQEVMRMVLEAIYEPIFMDYSHGFRPNRSCHSALRQIFSKFAGCTWWIVGDIKACFYSIPHKYLIQVLQKRIGDQRFIELIRKALNAGYLVGFRNKTDIVGTLQGSIISPILANIYMHELDKYIDSLKNEFDAPKTGLRPRNNESIRIKYYIEKAKKITDKLMRIRLLRKLSTQYRSIKNKVVGVHSQKLMYIRYGDDWVVAINGSFRQSSEILTKIKIFCKESLGLTVSEEKTKITNGYIDHVFFLGTRIKHAKVYLRKGIVQRNRRPLLLTAPMDKIKNKLKDSGFILGGRGRTRVTWLPLEPRQIVHLANSILRGYWNYYSFAQNRSKLVPWTYWIIRETVLRTLSRKLKLGSRAKAIKKFGTNVTIRDLTLRDNAGKPLIVAELVKPDYRINCGGFNIKLRNTEIPALYSTGISLATLDGLKCAVCDSEYRVEMLHVRLLKVLNPKLKALGKLMVKAHRKQIPLCRKCRMDHHRGEIKLEANSETRS